MSCMRGGQKIHAWDENVSSFFLFFFLRGGGGVSSTFVPDCYVERLCCRVGGEVKHSTSNELTT